MSQELHYTSAARGLRPGSRGFATVAASADLPDAMAERMEGLSAYQAVYHPGDPSEALNPIAFVHARLTVGGQLHHVLSRIGPAGLDYSGRPNKYAHHVVVEPEERPEGGPAWLLSQPGLLQDAWQGEPRTLAQGPPIPRGDRPPGIAEHWRTLTGDAGWAGVLAESFLADPRRPVFIVFRPGMELLRLFEEAIALLPASRRWDVEFSTYLTTLPPGISCTWRGVLEGSAQAKGARRLPNALIIDLGRPLGRSTGGALVHLARTGERLEIPEAPPPSPRGRRAPGRPPEITAGPPSRSSAPGRDRTRDDRDWLPDLAARLSEDESLLGGERLSSRRRPRSLRYAMLIAACLVPLLAAGFYWSPALRQRLGLAEAAPAPGRSDPADRGAAQVAQQPVARATTPVAESKPPVTAKPTAPKIAELAPLAAAENKEIATTKSAAVQTARSDRPPPRVAPEPLLLAFATPSMSRSAFGPAERLDRKIQLDEDAQDRIDILNGSDFQITSVPATPHAWEIVARTGSGVGGGGSVARLNHVDPRTWRFEWASHARARSMQVENLKDSILEFHGRDGRPIRVLLRDVELRSNRPLTVWSDQKILFDKLDTRIKSVEWARNPDVLEGTHWKPRIRRWRIVISRPRIDRGDNDTLRRVIEPGAGDGENAPAGDPALERDLIPGEVKLKVSIDPSRPGSIDVRIEPDPERVRQGQYDRSARMEELRKDTPKDKQGERDPLSYRRDRLRRLRDDGSTDKDGIKKLEREIAELERITEIRGIESLLTGSARVELSVVIGLDVEGPGILEIARVGEFAAGR
jgi:hypothetical protein